MKRIVALGDTHCGHLVGLTHPDFDVRHSDAKLAEIDRARRAYWDWYAKEIKALGRIDAVIFNGDAIEGKGEKSGGTELIEPDRLEQCSMAVAALEVCKAKAYYLSYGTPYHTGANEDFENKVAEGLGAVKIGGHDWLDVNGQVFDYKHFVGSSGVPTGRQGSLTREKLWNQLWNEDASFPKATIILRSHVHYFGFVGDGRYVGFTLPALQGMGSKYGARKCSGIVNFGFVHFDIETNGDYAWHVHLLQPRPHRALKL